LAPVVIRKSGHKWMYLLFPSVWPSPFDHPPSPHDDMASSHDRQIEGLEQL
jgi:hypothetical protein